jgi:hypothetical protein
MTATMHASRYYALPGLSPTRPNYHRQAELHNRKGDRKTVEVVYWPGGAFRRGSTFYSRETRPGCKGGVPAEGGVAAEWMDDGAVIAYHSRTGLHRYRVSGGVFREVRPRPLYARMWRARRRVTVSSDMLYWGLLGRTGR